MNLPCLLTALLAMNPTQTGYCDVPGTALYYEVSGKGAPLVLLHGNPSDLSAWDAQAAWFARRCRVVRYDLRGFGRSKPAPVPYSHAEDLKALLDCLGLERVVLVGWSMGGGAAVNFALSHPERVRGLVLVDSSLGGFPYSEAFRSSYAVFDGSLAREKGLEAALDEVLKHPLFGPAMKHPEIARKLRASVRSYSGWHWFNKDPGLPLRPPAFERLEEIKAPTLVLFGQLDIPDMIDISQALGRRIPGSRTIAFPEAGHCLPVELPDRFNRAVDAFLDGLPRESQ